MGNETNILKLIKAGIKTLAPATPGYTLSRVYVDSDDRMNHVLNPTVPFCVVRKSLETDPIIQSNGIGALKRIWTLQMLFFLRGQELPFPSDEAADMEREAEEIEEKLWEWIKDNQTNAYGEFTDTSGEFNGRSALSLLQYDQKPFTGFLAEAVFSEEIAC